MICLFLFCCQLLHYSIIPYRLTQSLFLSVIDRETVVSQWQQSSFHEPRSPRSPRWSSPVTRRYGGNVALISLEFRTNSTETETRIAYSSSYKTTSEIPQARPATNSLALFVARPRSVCISANGGWLRFSKTRGKMALLR